MCSKRRATKVGDWLGNGEIPSRAASGSLVALSAALGWASSELSELKRYVDNGDFLLEASDRLVMMIDCANCHLSLARAELLTRSRCAGC